MPPKAKQESPTYIRDEVLSKTYLKVNNSKAFAKAYMAFSKQTSIKCHLYQDS